jgi:hypothetical protein
MDEQAGLLIGPNGEPFTGERNKYSVDTDSVIYKETIVDGKVVRTELPSYDSTGVYQYRSVTIPSLDEDGNKVNNYYVNESVGIAAGILITAIHNAGLVTLTHTPSPMNFLTDLLERPKNERAFLLLPVGYPKDPTFVPELKRKNLKDIVVFY